MASRFNVIYTFFLYLGLRPSIILSQARVKQLHQVGREAKKGGGRKKESLNPFLCVMNKEEREGLRGGSIIIEENQATLS